MLIATKRLRDATVNRRVILQKLFHTLYSSNRL
jgi:hypothetical protein